MKKSIISWVIGSIFFFGLLWAAQQVIVSGDTLNQAWTKEAANNAEKAPIDDPTFTTKITTPAVVTTKTSGVAGYANLKEANSTDTDYVGFMGPASRTSSYAQQEPDADPTAGQIKVYAAPAGTGDVNGNPVSAITWKEYDDAIEFVVDGGGSAITTGVKGYLEIPWAATINSATLLADQSGSIVVDVWVDTYANYPPTDADSITASAVPTISTALKSQDTTLTGWTTSLAAGSIIGFNVDSATTVEKVTISLKVDK